MSDVAIYFDFEFYVHRCNKPGFASDYIKIKEIKEVLIGHAFSNHLSQPSDSEIKCSLYVHDAVFGYINTDV